MKTVNGQCFTNWKILSKYLLVYNEVPCVKLGLVVITLF